MKKYYIVCRTEFTEECLDLVSAESQEELEDKAFEVLSDEAFIEYVNSRDIYDGFIDQFFGDDQKSIFDEITGRIKEDIDDYYIELLVRKNVSKFFKEKPEYGEMYLKEFFKEPPSKLEFSREFYKFIFYRCDYTDFVIKEVNI